MTDERRWKAGARTPDAGCAMLSNGGRGTQRSDIRRLGESKGSLERRDAGVKIRSGRGFVDREWKEDDF